MKKYTKILSIFMFAISSFGIAFFVSADTTINQGESYTFTTPLGSFNSFALRNPHCGTEIKGRIGGQVSSQGYSPCNSGYPNLFTAYYYRTAGFIYTISNIPIGDYTTFENYRADNNDTATEALPETLHVIPPPPETITATSTANKFVGYIVGGVTDIFYTMINDFWPFVLVFTILYSFVTFLRRWITSLLIRSKNIKPE